MIQHKSIFVSAFFATASSSALILHPSPPIRRNSVTTLSALNDEYDGRPSYRRYQRDGSGESKNRFNVRNNSKYNTNNEDDAYELARELASRRGLHLSSRDQEQPAPNVPMDSYLDYDYRSSDVPPMYGSDYVGVSEQELPRVPMDYNANNNYNEVGYGSVSGGGGLKDLTWGGIKEQNDQKYKERYEVRRSRHTNSSSMGQRYKQPQPPRQPPREVRPPTDFRSRNDRLYQSGPSSQRSQASMGRRANNNYDEVRRMQPPRQQPPQPKSRSSSSNSMNPFEEVKRVNKLSELASTSERIDSPARRPMSQYPGPNAQFRPNIPYQQPPPPFRPPSMGRSGSVPPPQFMPPPQFVQMPQYQQQRRQPNLRPPPSIPLSQLALQPNIQPIDQPSKQQSQPFQQSQSFGQQQQSQKMPGAFNDRRQQQQQQQPPSFSAPGGRSQSESFGGNASASFSALPFQQMSQADFTRPFQGGSQQSQQQSTSTSNNSNPGAARQGGDLGGPPPDFNGPPPDFNGPPHPFDQRGPPPQVGQEPPPPPLGAGVDIHIFQNPFMNEPMFQEPQTPTQPKPKDNNNVKVPKDPNIEKMRRRAASSSSPSNNPGSGMKVPKDPLIEHRRRQQQQSTPQSNDGTKVPKDPFVERRRQQQQSTAQSNSGTKVPKDPFMERQRLQQRKSGTN
eukprot:scaffold4936_cov186-Skeletonema_dohrnii-CCMP3373.AAC.1